MADLKTNKKAFDTEVKIYKSIRRLLKEKELDDISVSDIANECGISRSSFYRNFKSIPEVLEAILAWYYQRYLDNRRSQINQLLYFFQYWINHRDLVTIMAKYDINMVKRCITNITENSFEQELALSIKISQMAYILGYWSNNKDKSIDEMYVMTRNLLEKRCLEYLLQ